MENSFKNKRIPKEIIKEIEDRINKGEKQQKIADELNLSVYTVRYVVRKKNLQHSAIANRVKSKSDIILNMYADGFSYSTIKRVANVELPIIHRVLEIVGLYQSKAEIKKRIIDAYLNQKLPITYIAKELRISYRRVYNTLVENNIPTNLYVYTRPKIEVNDSHSKENVIALYDAGFNTDEISKKLELPIYQIKRDLVTKNKK